jgi:hypothetical protein
LPPATARPTATPPATPTSIPTATPSPMAPEVKVTVIVPPNEPSGVNAGVQVRAGDRLVIDACCQWVSGVAVFAPGGGAPVPSDGVLPGAGWMALVGRIGSGPVFFVGPHFDGVASQSGPLILLANEWSTRIDRPGGDFADNTGSLTASIEIYHPRAN